MYRTFASALESGIYRRTYEPGPQHANSRIIPDLPQIYPRFTRDFHLDVWSTDHLSDQTKRTTMLLLKELLMIPVETLDLILYKTCRPYRRLLMRRALISFTPTLEYPVVQMAPEPFQTIHRVK